MNLVKSINFFQYVLTDHSGKEDHPDFISADEEQAEAVQSARAVEKLEQFLNLGRPGKFDISDLNDSEKDDFLGMLYELLNCGVVDSEQVTKDNLCEKLFMVNELVEDWTQGI